MKINQILKEAPPLPDDWDKEVYNKPNASFASQLRYATERAKKAGTGSSRVAFDIQYQGRVTVLKIAKNKKGLAQNEFESQMLEDYYYKGLGLAIPLIDYDEENDPPRWIHMEKAEKMKPNQWKQFFGGISHYEMPRLIDHFTGQKRLSLSPQSEEKYNQYYEDNDYFNALVDIAGNYGMPSGDFGRLSNWGVYQGKPVIIDIGHSQEVISKHYS